MIWRGVALHVLTEWVVKLGGGVRKLMGLLWLSQRHGRLARAQKTHITGLCAVDHGHKDADRAVYENIDPQVLRSVCLANQIKRENVDFVGNKQMRYDTGEMSE